MSLPAGIDKLPSGIQIRGNQIILDFRVKGKRYHKPLPNVAKINKQSIIYADRKRQVILVEIKEGKFEWANHFPESKEAHEELGISINRTRVVDLVEDWLEANELRLAASTYENYVKHARRIENYFKDREAKDLVKNDILKFQKHLVGPKSKGFLGLSIKTANETFIPLRGALTDAYYNSQTRHNIFERVRNIKHTTTNIADPFKDTELDALEAMSAKYHRPQDILMILFNCWVGLSTSELMPLAWEDVDFVNRKIKVQRNLVDGNYKKPKNQYREREIFLLDPAWEYLLKLRQYSFMLDPVEVEVVGYDNIKSVVEMIRPIFINVSPNASTGAWDLTTLQRRYDAIFRIAGIRRRGTNQTRHTYASRLITRHVPLELIARDMGHNGTEMLKKHYASIIKDETPNSARIISKIIGIGYKEKPKTTKPADSV